MKKLIAIFLPIFLFVSCSSTYKLLSTKDDAIKMDRDKDILVTTARNGFFNDKEYPSSGALTTNALFSKLRLYASSIDITQSNSFKSINKDVLIEYDYIIVPEIFYWEDRVTSLNGKPDKVTVGITVYDNTGNVLNYIKFNGTSTRVTIYNNDPIELINEALDKYIRQLFE